MKKGKQPSKNAPNASGSWLQALSRPVVFIPLAVVLTWLVYAACTGFGVTNWDDNHYIRELLLIRSLEWENIVRIFSTKVLLSYNPMTILSLAIDYKLGGNSEAWYHGVNVFLHISDTLLLYLVLRKLLKQDMVPAVVSLLFAIHPMHVEAVAWIACRKDVLYSFFFFASWLTYLSYKETSAVNNVKRWALYATSILLFSASGFSKIQAVTLPLVLLLSDYLIDRKLQVRQLIDKLPFIGIALGFGLYAVTSSTLAADQYAEPVTYMDRVIYSVQAFGLYSVKCFIPFSQSAIYPFPEDGSGESYLLLINGFLLLATVCWIVFRFRSSHPLLVFGLLFFLLNIFPTLHLVGLNSSLIYERFTYVAYIGLFIAFVSFPWLDRPAPDRRIVILLLLAIPFSVLAYQRSQVWKSSLTLWNDVLEKHPFSHEARNNRGSCYNESGEIDRALEDFNVSLQVNPLQPRTFNNRSIAHFKKKDYVRAIQDADNALALEPKLAEAWCNKGNAYYDLQQYDSAITFYSRAIGLTPNFPSNYCNRGTAFLKKGDYELAAADYRMSIRQSPNYSNAWRLLALAFAELGQDDSAFVAAGKAVEADPSSDAFRVLSSEYAAMGVRAWKLSSDGASPTVSGVDKAISCFEKAIAANQYNAEALQELGGMWLMKRDLAKAREYWRKALSLNPDLERARDGLLNTGGI